MQPYRLREERERKMCVRSTDGYWTEITEISSRIRSQQIMAEMEKLRNSNMR